MPLESEAFVSEYGWAMRIPDGFKQRKSGGERSTLVKFEPVAFSSDTEPSAMLTWMVSADSVDEADAQHFQAVTSSPGPITSTDAQQACFRIFPPIGEINEASVIALPDGRQGLEVLETFSQPASAEVRRGYQLIVRKDKGPIRYERVCFYASQDTFERLIDKIREASRTFRYP